VARKVVRLALREPRTVVALIEQFGYTDRLILAAFRCWPELRTLATTDETAATILTDLRWALAVVPKPWRSLLFKSDKRSPRVRTALEKIRERLGEVE